jgi:hypothetical protein
MAARRVKRKGAVQPKKTAQPFASLARVRIAAHSPKATRVKYLDAPPKFVKPCIHPRKVLPRVREGREREFHSASRRALVMAPPIRAAGDEVLISINTAITEPGVRQTASNVGEPSTAIAGNVALYTGNWYAAVSSDGGASFQYIDAANAFAASDPPNSHFCCDQVVNYIPSIDTFVWLLQYGPETDNLQRLAFANSADVAAGNWRLFDITTAVLGVNGAFLDFPDLAVGANSLYVTTNVFFPDGTAGAAVVRIPFGQITSGNITGQRFVSKDFFGFRVAQNCGTIAFFASHLDTSTLALFSWDEGQAAPTQTNVGVARWIGGNGYQSRTPDGNRWLDRIDPRITGATMAGSEVWFAWSVDAGSNQRSKPFVQIARIDSTNLTLLENVNVFDVDSAIAYGALSTNADGEVGISYMIGGGPRNPSHVVAILTNARRDVVVAQGDRGPLPTPDTGKGEWGDFLTVRPVFPDRKAFVATGYTFQGAGDGSNRDATPRFVVFARAGGGPAAPPPRGPSIGAGPIRDVNDLRVVSAGVAAKIKQAAGIATAPEAVPQAKPAGSPEPQPEQQTKPGVERWPVKTGTDADVAKVGKNVVNGEDFGPGIVLTTVEELIAAPRPADMPDSKKIYNAYQSKRAPVVETTIWRIEVTITAMKLEADGDYHLVLQGASGETMIGEVPKPEQDFVPEDSPWFSNIKAARDAVDAKFVSHLSPAAFVPMAGKLVPREAISNPQPVPGPAAVSFLPAVGVEASALTPFKTSVPPTRARITGVGLFDVVHGQMGVSQSNGIELHPILKIEWI